MIKMIALDFDGTFLGYTKEGSFINQKLIQELNDFIKRGGIAGFASGREKYDLREQFHKIELDWNTKNCPYPCFVIEDTAFFNECEGEFFKDIKEVNEKYRGEVANIIEMVEIKYKAEILDLLEAENIPVYGCEINSALYMFLLENKENAEKMVPKVAAYLKDKPGMEKVVVVRDYDILTITHKNLNKGQALKRAAEYYGLKPEEVLAIGDGYNDISMVAGDHGLIGGIVGDGNGEVIELVRNKGGIVGQGRSCDSVLSIIRDLKEQGKMI